MNRVRNTVLAAAIAFSASAAHAMSPASVAPSGSSRINAGNGGIELVHFRHSACREDGAGWHRSVRWGRERCGRHVGSVAPLAFWIWRCADGHCGYWHRNERRWKDGWRGNDGPNAERHKMLRKQSRAN